MKQRKQTSSLWFLSVLVFFEENNVENYFTGNQVCNSDQSASEALDCGEVCNKYCSSRNHKDDICNYDCNSKVCDYDGGDCDGGGRSTGGEY